MAFPVGTGSTNLQIINLQEQIDHLNLKRFNVQRNIDSCNLRLTETTWRHSWLISYETWKTQLQWQITSAEKDLKTCDKEISELRGRIKMLHEEAIHTNGTIAEMLSVPEVATFPANVFFLCIAYFKND